MACLGDTTVFSLSWKTFPCYRIARLNPVIKFELKGIFVSFLPPLHNSFAAFTDKEDTNKLDGARRRTDGVRYAKPKIYETNETNNKTNFLHPIYNIIIGLVWFGFLNDLSTFMGYSRTIVVLFN